MPGAAPARRLPAGVSQGRPPGPVGEAPTALSARRTSASGCNGCCGRVRPSEAGTDPPAAEAPRGGPDVGDGPVRRRLLVESVTAGGTVARPLEPGMACSVTRGSVPMRRMRGSWFAAALVPAVFAGVVYLQANAQTAPERQPLITEALVDAENGTLTINGFDFSVDVPTVSLGMATLPVLSVTEWGVVAGLPELLPGTYLLAVTWADGAGAVFYPTLGAVGPEGPQGEPGPFLSTGSGVPDAPMAYGGDAVVDGVPSVDSDHAGSGTNTHLGGRSLTSVTDGTGNTGVGYQALQDLTTGRDNAAYGRRSLYKLVDGNSNLAIGAVTMTNSIDASSNTAIGSEALRDNVSGEGNVAIGAQALQNNQGDRNMGIGRRALYGSRTGSDNIALGYNAGTSNQTGSDNVYIGNEGANGEEGVIRIGTEGVHTKTYLTGEVVGDINVVPVYQ